MSQADDLPSLPGLTPASQTPHTPVQPANSNFDATTVLHSTMDTFSNIGSRLNPFAQRLGKGFGQVRQYAQERLGTAEDVTELPQEYKDLEKRVDALRNVHQNLIRITRVHATQTYDYPTQIQESLADLSRSVNDRIQSLTLSPAEKEAAEAQNAAKQEAPQPKTLSHALSRACAQGAEQIGVDEPFGAALSKYATVQERVGNARIAMDNEINTKFVQPFNTTLRTSIENAMKARRNVQAARLTLDASKGRYRAAKPERSDAARLEVEQAEDQFVAAVEEATTLMKSVLDTPEPLRNLADLVAAQVTYFKEAHEILAELAPEIDEMQVTQEALYRNSRNE